MEKMGESELQSGLSKFFKPVTETQNATSKEITQELKPIKENIEKLTGVTFPAYQSIKPSTESLGEGVQYIGDIAEKFLRKFASVEQTDKIFGIKDEGGKFKIGKN